MAAAREHALDMGPPQYVRLVVFAGGFKVGKLVISSVGDEVIVHNVLIVPMNIMLISIYSAV